MSNAGLLLCYCTQRLSFKPKICCESSKTACENIRDTLYLQVRKYGGVFCKAFRKTVLKNPLNTKNPPVKNGEKSSAVLKSNIISDIFLGAAVVGGLCRLRRHRAYRPGCGFRFVFSSFTASSDSGFRPGLGRISTYF